jgi:hypothetical protein
MSTETINAEKYQAEHVGVVDMKKLAEPHQLVRVKHTGTQTPHIIFDRFNQPHKFFPGETREVDLPLSQIETLRHWRTPGRMIDMATQDGEVYAFQKREAPLHDLMILDVEQP